MKHIFQIFALLGFSSNPLIALKKKKKPTMPAYKGELIKTGATCLPQAPEPGHLPECLQKVGPASTAVQRGARTAHSEWVLMSALAG